MTKPISRKMAVDCLLFRIPTGARPYYAGDPQPFLICSICGEPLLPGQQIQFDHIHGHAMGGPHEYQNLRPIHYDPCHKAKSKRDVAALAKVDRITGVTKGRPKTKWLSGRKLQGRGFPKKKPRLVRAGAE